MTPILAAESILAIAFILVFLMGISVGVVAGYQLGRRLKSEQPAAIDQFSEIP
jgi:hypothetical protein